MKLSAKIEELKRRQAAKSGADGGGGVAISSATWVLLGLLVIFAALATWAVFEFFVWSKVPPALVGLWEVEAPAPQKGGTFEFFRSGSMEAVLKLKKKDVIQKARISVRDKTLWMIPRDSEGGEEATSKFIIRELTADSLILEPEKGSVLRLVRIE